MTNEGQALTAANIRYLLVIRELDTKQHGVRGSDIAQRLGVTKPSVFTMIQSLQESGLVKKEKYGTVFLSKPGQEKAEWYAGCFTLVLRWMESALGCTATNYENAAFELLADTPESDLPRLLARLQQLK